MSIEDTKKAIKTKIQNKKTKLAKKYNTGVEATKDKVVSDSIADVASGLTKRSEKELFENKEDTFRKIRRIFVNGTLLITPFFIGVPIKMIDDAIQRKVDLKNAKSYDAAYEKEIMWADKQIAEDRKAGKDVTKLTKYRSNLKISRAKCQLYIRDLEKKEKEYKETSKESYVFYTESNDPLIGFAAIPAFEHYGGTRAEYENLCFEKFNTFWQSTLGTHRVPSVKMESVTDTARDAVRSGVHAARNVAGSIHPVKDLDRATEPLDNIVNDTIDAFRDAMKSDKQKEIIEGDKYRVKLRNVIAKCVVYGGLAVLVHPALAAIAFLGKMAHDKHIDSRERSKIVNDLHQELAIVKEKIKDAENKGDHENKYKLMRIENKLEREIARVKYDTDDVQVQ